MSKTLLFLVILLTAPFIGHSQNKISFGANINSQVSFLNITKIQSPNTFTEESEPRVGYSIGLQAQYDFNSPIFLRSGLHFQSRTNRHIIKGYVFLIDILSGTQSRIQNDFTVLSLGIPVDAGYSFHFKNEKIKYFLGLSGILNIALDTKTNAKVIYETVEDERVSKATNGIPGTFFTMGAFAGVEIKLTEKMLLGIEPNIRITPTYITLYNFDSQAKTMETGITLRLRMG